MNKDNYKIKPPEIDENNLNKIDLPIIPSLPFNVLGLGKVNSGKSVLLHNLIMKFYKNIFKGNIFVFSTTFNNDPITSLIKDDVLAVFNVYDDKILQKIEQIIREDDDEKSRYLIIFDDFAGNLPLNPRDKKSAKLINFITTYRHYAGKEGKTSVIALFQKFKLVPNYMRENASHLFLLGKHGQKDLDELAETYDYLTESNKKLFTEIYKKTKKEKFDFMYAKLRDGEIYRNFEELIYPENIGINDIEDFNVEEVDNSYIEEATQEVEKKILKRRKEDLEKFNV